ncbi:MULTISPECIES: hypothetical protein [unclassified Actinoplanes]|uniref:hypothetical protein n=1 Tax=unclassified Actinoplanes TaxID=2626549 RepID=UPI0012BA5A2D|nr:MULTISPECIES: hypothetical protein [unclassified Actinoplanes]
MTVRRCAASTICSAVAVLAAGSPAAASGPPALAGDPYHGKCGRDSYGVNTTVITDHGHLHLTDPATGNEIGDAYFFYTPSCHGFFVTSLTRGDRYYTRSTVWARDRTGPVAGFSSLYPGNGIAWTYVLGNMAGHAACAEIAVTTPHGRPVTTIDLGCTAVIQDHRTVGVPVWALPPGRSDAPESFSARTLAEGARGSRRCSAGSAGTPVSCLRSGSRVTSRSERGQCRPGHRRSRRG